MNEPGVNFDDLPPASGVASRAGLGIPSVSEAAGGVADSKKARRRGGKPTNNGTIAMDRLPPHSPEVENCVLGCVLLSPNDSLPVAISRFGESGDVFYDLRNQTAYAVLCQMWANRIPIDFVTFYQRLKDFEILEDVGGESHIQTLPDAVPSAANISYYCDIVWEKYLLRKLISTCSNAVGRVYDFEGEVETVFDEVERDILSIRQGESRSVPIFAAREVVQESIQDLETLLKGDRSVTGLATGFADLDAMTAGLQPGDMIVIAARPSLGKTSYAMNIADYVAVEQGLPVGVFSLEMTKKALMNRMIGARARVNIRQLRYNSDRDAPRLTLAAGRLSSAPLYFDDTPGLSIMQIRARARMMFQMYGIKLVVIDYLQLAHATSQRAKESRQNEVSEISGGLKALAKELNVPVIVLSQLNREIERQKRKPTLSDLRESGAIEQDSDVVGFLYVPKLSDEESIEADAIPVNLLIAKQRNGPTGEVALTFLKQFTRFESAAKVSDEDVPRDADDPQAQMPYVND